MITEKNIESRFEELENIINNEYVRDMASSLKNDVLKYISDSAKQAEQDILEVVEQRDSTQDCLDKLLDLLDVEHEWSNIFGHEEAYQEASTKSEQLKDALRMCVDALYEAINIAPLDRLPQKAGSAIQQAQAILGDSVNKNALKEIQE